MQWPTADQRAQRQTWLEQRGRQLLAAGASALTLSEDDLDVLGAIPAEYDRVLCSLTLWGATDWVLERLAKFPSLEELTLVGGRFGDSSVPVLSKLTKLKALTMSARVNLSPDGLQALKAALPNCRFAGATACDGKPPIAPPPPAAEKPWWKVW